MKFSIAYSILLFTCQITIAQSKHFPLKAEESTLTKIVQIIGIDTVKLEFSRPNLKGRSLFGEMIPWNSVWRTGANASTKIELSERMFINGNVVPKGKYSLLSIPKKDKWIIILNQNTSLWGHYEYKQVEDLLRLNVKPINSDKHIETFNIVFKNTDKYSSKLEIMWGNIRIPLDIKIDKKSVDKRIMTSINQKLKDTSAHKETIISAHIYFFAAIYYQESNRDLNKALEWINKGIEIHNVNYFHFYK